MHDADNDYTLENLNEANERTGQHVITIRFTRLLSQKKLDFIKELLAETISIQIQINEEEILVEHQLI